MEFYTQDNDYINVLWHHQKKYIDTLLCPEKQTRMRESRVFEICAIPRRYCRVCPELDDFRDRTLGSRKQAICAESWSFGCITVSYQQRKTLK